MRIRSCLFLLGITVGLAYLDVYGQAPTPLSPADTHVVLLDDTLPAIRMKFEPAYLLIYFLVPGTFLCLGGHSYEISGEKRVLARTVVPYFNTTNDELLIDLYRKHSVSRAVWYGATSAGILVLTVGFMQRISFAPFFVPLPFYDSRNDNYLLWSGSLAAAGIAARIISFRQLRKAVNYYNIQYARQKPGLSLHLGLSPITPAGLGLYLKF